MAPEIEDVWLFNLREDRKRIVRLKEGISWESILILHLVCGVVDPGTDTLQGSLAVDLVVMGGFC